MHESSPRREAVPRYLCGYRLGGLWLSGLSPSLPGSAATVSPLARWEPFNRNMEERSSGRIENAMNVQSHIRNSPNTL